MLKYLFVIVSFCITFVMVSCEKNEIAPPIPDDEIVIDSTDNSDTIQDSLPLEVVDLKLTTPQLVNSHNQFGFELFSRVFAETLGEQNIFISPTSVSMALAMAYNGADGDTKTAMENTLKHSGLSSTALNQTYQSLIDSLVNTDEHVLLTIANAIFYEQNFSVLQSFIDTNQTYLDAEVQPLDFMNPESSEYINGWVSDKTNGLIPSIIDGRIPADAVMYVINAIYFNGIWKYQFDENNTVERNFSIGNGTVISVPTMNITETFRYTSNESVEMIELPYGNGSYSMCIVLPHVTAGQTTEFELSDITWKQWNSALAEREIQVALPKFSFAFETSLRTILSDMGMSDAFISNVANFSKISEFHKLSISDVKHKSFVEVSEQGTEAAAATSVEIVITSQPQIFAVNRPFIFVIQEKTTESIVFIGHVVNPLEE